jgi:hypothetical protein
MTVAPLPESPPHPAPAQAAPDSTEAMKHALAAILSRKLEQGYEIESRTESDAVVTIRGRRRWFGLAPHGASTRQRISFDDDCRLQTRTAEPPARAGQPAPPTPA